MTVFQAGFARGDVTPPVGAGLVGFFVRRESVGMLDPLLVSVLAVSDGERKLLILSLDNLGIEQPSSLIIRNRIAEGTGVAPGDIFLHCTHTHSAHTMTMGPRYQADFDGEVFDAGVAVMVKTAKEALADLAPATVHINACETPVPISFIRRYRMKDGSVRTNPGFLNPDIDHPIGEADHRVALTLFKREGKPEIALINFQTHPCVVGGYRFSADYPHFLRDTYEAVMPDSRCIFINGASGDTNHFDVTTPEDLPRDGYEFARHMGRTLAGTAISLHAMARRIDPLPLRASQKTVAVPTNRETDEEKLTWAAHIKELYEQQRYTEVCPEGGMLLTTTIAEATRMLRMKDAPEEKELLVSGLRLGEFSLIGFPGEPFTEIGLRMKEHSCARMTYVGCAANGYEGYFPMQSAYDEGGYEAKTSPYKGGVAEHLIKTGESVLDDLYKE